MTPREEYLAAVRARVPVLALRRAGLLREIRDGLDDAITAQVDSGLPPAEAERAAIAEFGSPVEVAADVRAELAVGAGRTVAVATGAVSAVQMVVAGLLWRADGAAHGFPAIPDGYGALAVSVDVLAFVVLLAGVLAWAVLGPAGRIAPHLNRVRTARAVGIAVFAALALQSAGGIMLAVLGPGLEVAVSSPVDVVRGVAPSVVLIVLAGSCLRLTSRRWAVVEHGADDAAERGPLTTS